MINIIEKYINNLTKEDIIKFATNNNLTITNEEINFVYSFIKCNYKDILANPDSFDITIYKNKFSENNYNFINNLIKKYIKYLK